MEWRVGEEEEDSERGKERMVVGFFLKANSKESRGHKKQVWLMFCFEIGAEIGWEGSIKYFCFVSPNLATLPVKFTGQSSLCSVVAVVGVGWVWWSCWWAKQTNHPKKAEKKESTITASMLSISLSNVTCVYSSFKHKKNPFRIKIISSPVTPPSCILLLPPPLSVSGDGCCLFFRLKRE